jgi:N utilization substance protein A
MDNEKKHAKVYLVPDQVSLAIGRRGVNIKLACELTGYEIDVFRDGEADVEDVDLEEFADEIDGWILDELKNIGCDTAKSDLQLTDEDIIRRTELEEETVKEIRRILQTEFE